MSFVSAVTELLWQHVLHHSSGITSFLIRFFGHLPTLHCLIHINHDWLLTLPPTVASSLVLLLNYCTKTPPFVLYSHMLPSIVLAICAHRLNPFKWCSSIICCWSLSTLSLLLLIDYGVRSSGVNSLSFPYTTSLARVSSSCFSHTVSAILDIPHGGRHLGYFSWGPPSWHQRQPFWHHRSMLTTGIYLAPAGPGPPRGDGQAHLTYLCMCQLFCIIGCYDYRCFSEFIPFCQI